MIEYELTNDEFNELYGFEENPTTLNSEKKNDELLKKYNLHKNPPLCIQIPLDMFEEKYGKEIPMINGWDVSTIGNSITFRRLSISSPSIKNKKVPSLKDRYKHNLKSE